MPFVLLTLFLATVFIAICALLISSGHAAKSYSVADRDLLRLSATVKGTVTAAETQLELGNPTSKGLSFLLVTL